MATQSSNSINNPQVTDKFLISNLKLVDEQAYPIFIYFFRLIGPTDVVLLGILYALGFVVKKIASLVN